jgi:hypothetical protein
VNRPDQGRVSRNAYTTAPYTSGFYAGLYSGERFDAFGSSIKADGSAGLLEAIDDHGIYSKLILSHANAMPQTAGAPIYRRGLRSMSLTRRYSPFLEQLGFDCDLMLTWGNWGALSAAGIDTAGRLLFQRMNPQLTRPGSGNLFLTELLPEIRSAAMHENAFVLFHAFYGHLAESSSSDVFSKLPQDLWDEAHANGYRYDQRDSARVDAVRQYRAGVELQVEEIERNLLVFLSALRAEDPHQAVTVVLTSDHGSIYEEGRLWYGYHTNQQVTRVPLIVFGHLLPGDDVRLVSTADLTRSILDFFGLRGLPGSDGQSLFNALGQRSMVSSLASRSEEQREWLLALVFASHKYVINLHPRGAGEVALIAIDGSTERLVSTSVGATPEIADLIAGALDHYGVPREQVHSIFRVIGSSYARGADQIIE